MHITTPEEIREIMAELNLSIETYETIREDNMSDELRAAIQDKEAFKRYLEQSKY